MAISRLVTLFLLLLCLGLGGCQGLQSNHGHLELTVWHGINPPPNREVFQRLVDRFNQSQTEFTVKSLYIGQSDQQLPKILTAVIGNSPPDLWWFASMGTGRLVDLGAIRPLDDWWEGFKDKDDIEPSLRKIMTFNGHVWSIPMAANNVALFYRPSLLAEAGIRELPRTWEELRAVAKKLTRDRDGDGKIDQSGIFLPLGKGEWTVFTWLPFMFSAGGDLVKDGQLDLMNEGAVAALQLWSDLMKDGSALLSQPERGYEQDNLIAGRVAMQLTGPWTLGYLATTSINDDFGVIPIPYLEKRATVIGGENLFLMKTNPVRERAALKFLEYILSEEFQTEWALGTGYLPVTFKARNSERYQAFVAANPVLKVFLEQMNFWKARPLLPGYNRLSDALGRAIEGTLLGTEPRVALTKARDRLQLVQGTE